MNVRGESGQVIVTTALVLALVLGMAGLVVDVGSWYGAQRHLQTVADAAALAGAQKLPDQGTAQSDALDYAQRNWSGTSATAVSFPDAATIKIDASRTAPGFFAKVWGAAFSQVTVRAHAEATLMAPETLKDVAPVAVPSSGACTLSNPSCFGVTTDLTFPDSGLSSSQAGLVDLCSATGGKCGSASDLKNLIADGLAVAAPVNVYYNAASGKKESLRKPIEDAVGRVLLFPVFDPAKSSPSKGYYVVGWSAFRIDRVVSWSSHDWHLQGVFVTYLASGIGSSSGGGTNYGVSVIALTR